MNLPATYARVVAAKPQLAVPNLEVFDDGELRLKGCVVLDSEAYPLILAHWLEALAEFHVPGSTKEETQ